MSLAIRNDRRIIVNADRKARTCCCPSGNCQGCTHIIVEFFDVVGFNGYEDAVYPSPCWSENGSVALETVSTGTLGKYCVPIGTYVDVPSPFVVTLHTGGDPVVMPRARISTVGGSLVVFLVDANGEWTYLWPGQPVAFIGAEALSCDDAFPIVVTSVVTVAGCAGEPYYDGPAAATGGYAVISACCTAGQAGVIT